MDIKSLNEQLSKFLEDESIESCIKSTLTQTERNAIFAKFLDEDKNKGDIHINHYGNTLTATLSDACVGINVTSDGTINLIIHDNGKMDYENNLSIEKAKDRIFSFLKGKYPELDSRPKSGKPRFSYLNSLPYGFKVNYKPGKNDQHVILEVNGYTVSGKYVKAKNLKKGDIVFITNGVTPAAIGKLQDDPTPIIMNSNHPVHAGDGVQYTIKKPGDRRYGTCDYADSYIVVINPESFEEEV